MSRPLAVLRYGSRVLGGLLILLGILFWTGNAYELLPIHMLLGLIVVIDLWLVSGWAARRHVAGPMGIVSSLWGLLVVGLGITQTSLLVGGLHWIIRVVHLLVGVASLAFIERLARRIDDAPRPNSPGVGRRANG